MIKLKKNQTGKPFITTMELAGQAFEIELIPKDAKEIAKRFEPFRKKRLELNKLSKKMEYVDQVEDSSEKYNALAEDMLCEIVNNFWGIGDDEGNQLDGTLRENKILLGNVRVEDTEDVEIYNESGEKAYIRQPRTRLFRAVIFEKAGELAAVTAEADEKN